MNYHKHQLLLLVKALFLISFIPPTNSSNRDAAILLRVKNDQLQDPLRMLGDWIESTPNSPCNWTGISCDARTNNVISVNLSGVNILGSFRRTFAGFLPYEILTSLSIVSVEALLLIRFLCSLVLLL
ncbi:UNVERIFIED_CONTAM: hypothetical protein Sangu_0212700 [Sesamum angustifolium]|uniref:Leucine-rich repeat-containing N-terminal plant-type domain-containing protein n=1 Tax=Sesamum angustifolium TaxID=2727405 RepID=A0AAW2RN11_9LAMI